MRKNMVDVDTGHVAVGQGGSVLRANAIGSCIVVTAYDVRTLNAGMAHILLPGRAPEKAVSKTRYAVDAIERLLALMAQAGSAVEDVQACLIGAGNVLRDEEETICNHNIASVTQILTEKKISIRACNLGGYERKSALLDITTGQLSYTQGDGPPTVLWCFIEETAAP
jgi:chemotaxis protein CheD